MATKTWKLGEVAQGGIITVETKGNIVTIIGKEWDYSKGSRRSSDQSKAEEFTRLAVNLDTTSDGTRRLSDFLCDLSISYWADQIMKWVESKVDTTKSNLFW